MLVLIKNKELEVIFTKIIGHSKDIYNERADYLAKNGHSQEIVG